MTSPPSDPAGVNAVGQLILGWQRATGLTIADLARRSGLKPQTIHRWLKPGYKPVRIPETETIEGLSRGMELPRSTLYAAAAEAVWGLRVFDTSSESRRVVMAAMAEADDDAQQAMAEAALMAYRQWRRRHI